MGAVIGWFVQPLMFKSLNEWINRAVQAGLPQGAKYIEAYTKGITEPFMLQLQFAMLIGLIIAIPFMVLQVWGFLAPALRESEQRPFKRLAPLSIGLFVVGAAFAWLILPETLGWFAGYVVAGTEVIQPAGQMIFFVLKMLLAFGVAFQLPLIVYGLGMAGLLSADTLLKYWRHGASVIFVVAAVITPSADPVSMIVMAVPLTILFIASVYAVKFMQRKQVRPEAEEDAPMAVLDMGEPIAQPEEEINDLGSYRDILADDMDEENRTSG